MTEKEATHLKEEAGHGSEAADSPQGLVFQKQDCGNNTHTYSKTSSINKFVPVVCRMCEYFVKFNYPRMSHDCYKNIDIFVCERCKRPFWKAKDLKHHLKKCGEKTGDDKYAPCLMCDYIEEFKFPQRAHTCCVSSDTLFTCKRCKKPYWNNDMLASHEKNCTVKNFTSTLMHENEMPLEDHGAGLRGKLETIVHQNQGLTLLGNQKTVPNKNQENGLPRKQENILCQSDEIMQSENQITSSHESKQIALYKKQENESLSSETASHKFCLMCEYFIKFNYPQVDHFCKVTSTTLLKCQHCGRPFWTDNSLAKHHRMCNVKNFTNTLMRENEILLKDQRTELRGKLEITVHQNQGLALFENQKTVPKKSQETRLPGKQENIPRQSDEIMQFENQITSSHESKQITLHKKQENETFSSETTSYKFCSMCEYFVKFNYPQKNHFCKVTCTALLKCESCGRPFWNDTNLIKHHKKCKGIYPPEVGKLSRTSIQKSCSVCDYFVRLKLHPVDHFCNFDKREVFVCSFCKYPFAKQKMLNKHLKLHHGKYLTEVGNLSSTSIRKSCFICDYFAHFKLQPVNHFCNFDKGRILQCNFCKHPFTNQKKLNNHLKLKHAADSSQGLLFQNQDCGNNAHTYSETSSIKKFVPVVCKMCEYFEKFSHLYKSHDCFKNIEIFICERCQKPFWKTNNLKQHSMHCGGLKKPGGDKSTSCLMCDHFAEFKLPQRAHICHASNVLFTCKHCSKPYWNNDSLAHHEKNCTDPSLKAQVASSQEQQQRERTFSIKTEHNNMKPARCKKEQNDLQGEMPAFRGKWKINLCKEEISLTEKNSREEPHYALKMIKNEKEETRQASQSRKRQLEEINEQNAKKQKLAFYS